MIKTVKRLNSQPFEEEMGFERSSFLFGKGKPCVEKYKNSFNNRKTELRYNESLNH